MGNLCSWCIKSPNDSHANGDYGGLNNIERSTGSSIDDERTPLINKPDSQQNSTLFHHSSIPNGDSSTIAPLLPQPQIINEPTTVSTNETAETKMAFIVEGMLSKLIDVGGSNTNIPQTNSNLNTQNEQLKHLLNKSLSSTKLTTLPDAGLNNLPSLLSGRPISIDTCHFVAHTAGELSRLLIDEIKITHKEDLVVVFE